MELVATVSQPVPDAVDCDLPYDGERFLPGPLIYEDNGKVAFSPMAMLASVRCRDLSRAHFERGLWLTSVVRARRFKEVDSQYSQEEITSGEEILALQDGVLRKHKQLERKKKQEEKKAFERQNLILLQHIEERLAEISPVVDQARVIVAAAGLPVIELVATLRVIQRLDRKANGWKVKAQRQIACGLFGRHYFGAICGRSHYKRFRCKNRYCNECGPGIHNALVAKSLRYREPLEEFLSQHPLYRLRILDITAIKRGDRIPGPEDVRKFKRDVKTLHRKMVDYFADRYGLPRKIRSIGYLFCVEFGEENNNLHCHGVLLSPYIEHAWINETWRKIRNDGSHITFIAEARSFDDAMRHALEYTGKYSACSAHRAHELEVAFEGVRRIDALGWFHGILPKDASGEDLRCSCENRECFLVMDVNRGWLPVSEFESRGIRDVS